MTVFDISMLERLAAVDGGRRRLLATLVQRAIVRLPQDLAGAERAWIEDDIAEARRRLHGARGAAATVGARRFAQAAARAEAALMCSDAAFDAELACARAELASTLAAARQWLQRFGDPQ
jgi:HPt (histidine-containing phosphotransfer) domain-containing protein